MQSNNVHPCSEKVERGVLCLTPGKVPDSVEYTPEQVTHNKMCGLTTQVVPGHFNPTPEAKNTVTVDSGGVNTAKRSQDGIRRSSKEL